VANEIFPCGNAFLDLHSGGSCLDLLPSTVIEPTVDSELPRRNLAAAQAFGAPFTVVIGNYGDMRTATATACAAGLTTVGTELGGSGSVRLENLELCRSGIRRVLIHFGLLADDENGLQPPQAAGETPGLCDGSAPDIYRKFGFIGTKVPLPHGPADGLAGLSANREFIAEARRKAGPDHLLMIDCYLSLDVPCAIALADAIAEFRIEWIET
jgi:hypothetical protein